MEISLIILAWIFTFIRPVVSQARPLPVTWSSAKFGPDGPWQAVSIVVGTNQGASAVSLYPGGAFDSNILVKNFCNGTTTGCNAAAGGLYDVENSPSADYRSIQAQAGTTGWGSGEPMNITGEAVFTIDNFKLASLSTAFDVKSAVFASVITSNVAMPNGSSYPVWLGNLALGSPNPVQTFLVGNGSNVTGQLLTGNLRSNGEIPSSSFGLHIGSANLGQAGSLILGGYDQSRVVGPVASYDIVGVDGRPKVNLVDVNIGVQTGGSPFNTSNIPSLYSAGGNKSTSVVLNPLVPYMSLPPATCAAIAQWLPVTFKPSIGLYTWNTNDYRYKSIISSPSYLAFTFQEAQNGNLTIKVPFSLLNLTLESPIVATPTRYFPCHPWTSSNGDWYLGRAFMQAAYLSMNWEQGKFTIGQATGPGMGPSSIQSINPTDISINAGDVSGFQDSWSSTWTVIAANTSSSGSTVNSTSNSSGSSGLSQSAQIGIGVGVGLGGALLLALLVLLLLARRRRNQRSAAAALEAERLEQQRQQEQQQQRSHQSHQSAPHPPPKSDWSEKGHQTFGAPPPDHKHPYHGRYNQHQPLFMHELAVPPRELDAPRAIHEAPQTQRTYHEAPSNDFAHEIDSTEIGSRSSPRSGSGSALKYAEGEHRNTATTLSSTASASTRTSSARGSRGGSQSYAPVSAITRSGSGNALTSPTTASPSTAVSPETPTSSMYPFSAKESPSLRRDIARGRGPGMI